MIHMTFKHRLMTVGLIFVLLSLFALILVSSNGEQPTAPLPTAQARLRPTPTREPPTPQPTTQPAPKQAPVEPVTRVLENGTVVTNPVSILIIGRNYPAQQEDSTAFVVLRIPSTNRIQVLITHNIQNGNTYFLNDPLLENWLASEYKRNCQEFGKCEWVELTINQREYSIDSKRSPRREDLLK